VVQPGLALALAHRQGTVFNDSEFFTIAHFRDLHIFAMSVQYRLIIPINSRDLAISVAISGPVWGKWRVVRGQIPGGWTQKVGLLPNFKAATRLMFEHLASGNESEPTRKRMFSTADYESTMNCKKFVFLTPWPPPN